ncbi:MAG: methylmalonyl Co-A mutase-associated GTPase MeaB [Chitinophagales bacterium]|nr:methylmalonyl Co-A mutase-associated GTPase MeaB [Chitinophagales bacterium]
MKPSPSPNNHFQHIKKLARSISIVENDADGYEELLEKLLLKNTQVVGITGPPGSGKSSILNRLVQEDYFHNKSICILAIDPSSPFNYGALLGDRIRISSFPDDRDIYFRSIASRGSLGGLSDKIIEILEVCRSADFDMIFIETVGVGQSEVEVAGLADTTVVVLTPESGDQVQSMKAGLMEIADIFALNKADHPAASTFHKNLQQVLEFKPSESNPPIVEMVATEGEGTSELLDKILSLKTSRDKSKKVMLLSDKIYRIIQKNRMKMLDKERIRQDLRNTSDLSTLNIYSFVKERYSDLLNDR